MNSTTYMHERRADDPVVVEDPVLLGQRDPAVARGQTEDRDRGVEIDPRRERKAHRPAEPGQDFDHRSTSSDRSLNSRSTSPRTAATSPSRSSRLSPAVGDGLAERRPRRAPAGSTGLPFRIASRAPLMATGTIGACALSAMTKPPFLNGSSSPVRLRVPSGKIRNELPSRKRLRRRARSPAGSGRGCRARAARSRRDRRHA